MKQVIRHFRSVDPVLASAVKRITPIVPSRDYFSDLCEIIIQQQLSEKAGETIWQRFRKLIGRVTPTKVLATPDAKIRTAGISWSKISYVKNLARYGSLRALQSMSDREVIRELTKIKGIGPWSAEMFLMFSLAREDVFSYGDVGLRNAMRRLYKFKKDPTVKQMEPIVIKWSPYRTYAARILWDSLVE